MKPMAFYVVIALGVCTVAIKRPANNFDMFGYIASVEAFEGKNSEAIFGKTLQATSALTAAQRDGLFTKEYQRDLISNGDHLGMAIPFYSVKPLYVETIRLLEKLTKGPALATILPSVIGYLGIAALVWLLVGRQSPILATLIALQPLLIQAARLQTPDAFSTMLLVLGSFLCWEKRKLPGVLVLLGSVWVRPDTIVYLGFIFSAMWFEQCIDSAELATASVLALASWFAIGHFGYSWTVLFYNSFINAVPDPTALNFHVTPRIYLHVARQNLEAMWFGYGGLLVVLVLAGWHHKQGRGLLLPFAGGAILHFALYPSAEERLYLPLYVVASIMAARGVLQNQSHAAFRQPFPAQDRSLTRPKEPALTRSSAMV